MYVSAAEKVLSVLAQTQTRAETMLIGEELVPASMVDTNMTDADDAHKHSDGRNVLS